MVRMRGASKTEWSLRVCVFLSMACAFLHYLNQLCDTPTRYQLAAIISQFLPSHADFSPYQFLAAGDAHPVPETVH